MQLFIKQHILTPQTTGPRKRHKRMCKLATFIFKATTVRESKKREQELTNITKNAMEIRQANRICTQTSPYPLAMADIQGNMRSSQKSKFLDTLTQCLQFDQAVTGACPMLTHPPQDPCVIIDMLYYIHMPLPPHVTTFDEFFDHLWNLTVGKFSFQHTFKANLLEFLPHKE